MKSLLHQSAQLDKLIEQTQLYEALLSIAKDALPAKIAAHLIGVSFEGQTLLLQIDNNLWTTKLRFYESELLMLYQQHFPHLMLNQILIRVLPIAEPRRPKPKRMTSPSESDAQNFQALSRSIEHKGLKSALEKLAARAEKETEN